MQYTHFGISIIVDVRPVEILLNDTDLDGVICPLVYVASRCEFCENLSCPTFANLPGDFTELVDSIETNRYLPAYTKLMSVV